MPHSGIPMSKLAHKLGLDASTLTRNIQKLEKMGLVERKPDTYDKRVKRVVLTKHGLTIADNIEESLLQINNEIIDQIDLDIQEKMVGLLEKLVWAMDCVREE